MTVNCYNELTRHQYIALEILKAMLGNADEFRGDAEVMTKRANRMATIIINREEDEKETKT